MSTQETVNGLLATTLTLKNMARSKTLANVANETSVEPFMVLSRNVSQIEQIKDINQILLNMFTAYYLQAVNIITRLDDIRVRKILNRVGTGYAFEGHTLDITPFAKYKLPTGKDITLAMEALSSSSIEKTDKDLLADANSLAVGKLVEIKMVFPGEEYEVETSEKDQKVKRKSSDQEITVPVLIKPLVNITSLETITKLFVSNKEDISFIERYYKWKAGAINWSDFFFAKDLIRQYKKDMITGDSELIGRIEGRKQEKDFKKVSNSVLHTLEKFKFDKSFLSSSYGENSNIFVITKKELKDIESKTGYDVENDSKRTEFLKNGLCMILAVIDTDRERVRFYIDGSDGYSDISFRELKGNIDKKADITDMLKMIQMGSAPTF